MPNLPRAKILPHLHRKLPRFPAEAEMQSVAERGRRRIRALLAAGALFVTLFAGYPLMNRIGRHETVNSAATVTACDKLAAHPSDTQKLTIGVNQEQMDVAAAKTACIQALTAHPHDGRTLYQLSRTYIGDRDFQAGLTYLRESAESGYAQGQFSLAMFFIQGPERVAKECEGGQLLVKAARQRHFYAKIYLGRYWLDGMFKDCGLPVTDTELTQMISAAGELTASPEEQHDLTELEARWEKR
ncbi:MAG: hypothetical protein EPO08_11185 [Rhodospirillaceae bacterium]|nr:MAG: hypothetical protein EPO08_11185 [Rhodospirillaceae bacterium]